MSIDEDISTLSINEFSSAKTWSAESDKQSDVSVYQSDPSVSIGGHELFFARVFFRAR